MKKAQTSVCGLVNQKWVAFRTHAQAIDAGAIRTVNTVKRDGHHFPRKASVMLAAVVQEIEMEIEIYFDIVSNDGVTIGVGATATLSGSYKPADFHHDIEDERECIVNEISFTDEDGEEMAGSEKLKEIVYEHVDDNFVKIFKDAEKNIDETYLDDFKSDQDYAELI